MESLTKTVGFLSSAAAYPARPGGVQVIETHMSWVFLAGDDVYKLKKPVKYPFLDFSTVEARRHHCEEEVRLNRRLAGDTYIGVVPLCRDGSGRLVLGGEGEIVDWLVHMKRLSTADMLNERIRAGNVAEGDVVAVGRKLGDFYRNSRPEVAEGRAYVSHLFDEQEINRSILARPEFGLGSSGFLKVVDDVSRGLDEMRATVEARVADGHVVEGHGDLRPEHICLVRPPLIIDCLEFNRGMRIVDPYDEVNYLGLECQLLGAAWIRPKLIEIVDDVLGARPGEALLGLLGAFRAVLRARISLAHLFDAKPLYPDRWPVLARAYLRMAQQEYLSFSAREGD